MMSVNNQRILPVLTPLNRHFWQSGRLGVLQILRCRSCEYWIHVPQPRCTRCLSENVEPAAVSGLGLVEAFTINRKAWASHMSDPFNIAIVSLPEQAGLRITTALIDIELDRIQCGLPVKVSFLRDDDIWLPVFMPV